MSKPKADKLFAEDWAKDLYHPYVDRCGACGCLWEGFAVGVVRLGQGEVQCLRCKARYSLGAGLMQALAGVPLEKRSSFKQHGGGNAKRWR